MELDVSPSASSFEFARGLIYETSLQSRTLSEAPPSGSLGVKRERAAVDQVGGGNNK